MEKVELSKCVDRKGKLKYEVLLNWLVRTGEFLVKGEEVFLKDENQRYWQGYQRADHALQVKIRSKFFYSEDQGQISRDYLEKVIGGLSVDPRIQVNSDYFIQEGKVNFKNGIFDLELGLFSASDNGLDFDYCLDANYLDHGVVVKSPKWKEFLKVSLGCELGSDKHAYLMENVGYLLSDYSKLRQSVVFLGASGSGKSTLAKLVEACVKPVTQVSSVTLRQLGERFETEIAASSKLNVCHELEAGKSKSMQVFKMLAAKEPIMVQKKYIRSARIVPRGQLLFCGNHLPDLPGEDAIAIMSRLNLIHFAGLVSDEQRDIGLYGKLHEELDAIATLALDAFSKVVKRGGNFTRLEESKEMLNRYLEEQESVKSFIEEQLEFNLEAEGLQHLEINEFYMDYCRSNFLVSKSYKELKLELLRFATVKEARFRKNGRNSRGLKGIRFRSGGDF